jgi:prepilin-type N-terminal cleavage/methylation domain-containing protein
VRQQQSGFTLVEIAIVLVIIGLLLGGVLKGQELINSAKVKNFANDFRNIPLFIYGYQDKFRALPGDDAAAVAHLGAGANVATGTTLGNGTINGLWDSVTATDESWLFWQHARLANFAAGPTTWAAAAATDPYVPKNADGGRIGIQGGTAPISGLAGSYYVCSSGIQGKFVLQLDTTMDDGNTAGGSMRAVADGATNGSPLAAGVATASIVPGDSYTVCVAF